VADAAFDAVLSGLGAIFAPRHEVVAAELTRACRPGGTMRSPRGYPAAPMTACSPCSPTTCPHHRSSSPRTYSSRVGPPPTSAPEADSPCCS
jgi:hypothetical protein